MAVRVVERRLGTVPWLVVHGPAAEAFTSLGAHLRTEIRAVVDGLPGLAVLRRHVASEPGKRRFAAVCRATQSRFPGPWAELTALAAGAGVAPDDLALLNFRGDLGEFGPGPAAAAAGCSDLAWRRQRSFIAHNEDEPDFFAGRCALLTLVLDGQQPVATFAKPGFLPSSTFTVTGSGLVWAIDHVQAGSPGPGAGRHGPSHRTPIGPRPSARSWPTSPGTRRPSSPRTLRPSRYRCPASPPLANESPSH